MYFYQPRLRLIRYIWTRIRKTVLQNCSIWTIRQIFLLATFHLQCEETDWMWRCPTVSIGRHDDGKENMFSWSFRRGLEGINASSDHQGSLTSDCLLKRWTLSCQWFLLSFWRREFVRRSDTEPVGPEVTSHSDFIAALHHITWSRGQF